MTERFNFYDIYGYAIPGFLLLGLLCLPFGLAKEPAWWPPLSWTSAAAAAVLGYVAGHLLQALMFAAIPHPKLHDQLLLDSDATFSAELKAVLARKIADTFGLDVVASGAPLRNVSSILRHGPLAITERSRWSPPCWAG